MPNITIRKATVPDYNAVASLLKSASLPIEGVAEHFQNFLVAEIKNEIVGTIGLEIYGETALLRSAVVSASLQKIGVGTILYNHLIENAKSRGIRRLILLTNTAEAYFHQKEFRTIDPQSVTGPITTSAEFTGACPSTAVCMEMLLL